MTSTTTTAPKVNAYTYATDLPDDDELTEEAPWEGGPFRGWWYPETAAAEMGISVEVLEWRRANRMELIWTRWQEVYIYGAWWIEGREVKRARARRMLAEKQARWDQMPPETKAKAMARAERRAMRSGG
ncbi:hypothetical protein ACI3ET_06705 [Ornithinimicrobium sp. LYQ121]|uniref:hypothetical protein n=1 Tax=Ornithinimicrobium sp. LYQ121 TaxID=3378801 RepID=UPI003853CE1F